MKFNQIYQTFSKLDLAEGSEWTTVTTSDQTFNAGDWTGTFTGSASGEDTRMQIGVNWDPASKPLTSPTGVGYSYFDTGIDWVGTGKARLFSVLVTFTDISQLTNANNLRRLIFGLYVAETAISARIATTAGAFYGGEISDNFADFNFNQKSLESITNAGLISTTGDTIAPTANGFLMSFVLSPNGQIMLVKAIPISTPSGLNSVYASVNKEKVSGFQTPSGGTTIKLGCWWGTDKTATGGGGFTYDVTYKLQYAYKELN